MAITETVSDPDAPGAYCRVHPLHFQGIDHKTTYFVTYARGCVVALRERNYHDDSDFYAVYYDPETDTFKETCYATTRGWTYLNGARVDASPELAERYRVWERKQKKFAHCRAVRLQIARIRDDARTHVKGRALARILKMTLAERSAVCGLLRVQQFRSTFRRDLRAQLETWLNDPDPQYLSPFSRRQWACLLRF